jgi:hypothetical protein
LEIRNWSQSLAIILVLAVSFLGLLSQSGAVGVAAATHSGGWSGTWSHGSNTWTHNSWSYTNSWSWTQNQNHHSWSHSQHSYWNGGGQYNGGGYYNNGGYYNGGYYGGGYPYQPSPNQCYPYQYNGCYPSNPSGQYCPTPSYCPAQVTEPVTTVTAQPTVAFTPFTPTVTMTVTAASQPNFNASSYPTAGYNQNYAPQPTGGDNTVLYLGLAVLGVIAVLGVLGIVYAVPRLRPQPTQPAPSGYAQPTATQPTGIYFCGRCGTPAPQGVAYCSKCGLRLG